MNTSKQLVSKLFSQWGAALASGVLVFSVTIPVYADTGPHEGGAGCLPGEQEVACTSSYGKGCEQYQNSSEYYVGRWESHGVQMKYTFCKKVQIPKKTAQPGQQQQITTTEKRTQDPFLPLKVGGFVLLASVSFLLLRHMKMKQ